MAVQKVALIFDDKVRPDTTGVYCRRALEKLVDVRHYQPSELGRIPRDGFDLYLNIDDGLEYRFPKELRPCAWWAIDTHLNLDWCRERARDFDFVFTAQRDGGEQIQQAGIAASWLPLACDPDIHRKHEIDKTFDVCFVGHFFPGPRAELLQVLQRRFPNHFIGQRFFDEMAQTYSASRTVFNRSILNDINMRVFEALACGSLLVTNDLQDNGQEDLFRDGVHLATYRDAEELVDKIDFYLARDAVRERVAAAGRAEVLGRDTYRHRMEWLLGEVARGLTRKTVPTSMPGSGSPALENDKSRAEDTIGHESLLGGGGATNTRQTTVSDDNTAFWRHELLALVPAEARNILAVGCGVALLRKAHTITAEAEIVGIEIGAEPADDDHQPKDQVTDDFERSEWSFADQSFDTVICRGLLEQLRDPLAGLRRLRQWLRPGGCLIAEIPNVRYHPVVRNLLEGHWGGQPRDSSERAPIHFFTRREIKKVFQRTGFQIDEMRALPALGYEEWHMRGRPGEVHVGRLRIGGLDTADAEEFYTSGYVVRATVVPLPDYCLTSIIILTHNQLPYTRACVDSIRRYTDETYELIFVDNASSDGTVAYLHSLPGAKVIVNERNLGFPVAANQGIDAAAGKQILLLNNDTVVTTGWLQRLLQALHQDPKVGLAGPCSNQVSGEQQVVAGYSDLAGLAGFAWDWTIANEGRTQDTDRLVGFCLLMRREVVEEIGCLDERFGIGCFEDDDYCRRALAAGYRAVIARDAFVHHFGGRTFIGSGVDFAALMRANQRLYQEKWAELTQPSGSAVPSELLKERGPSYTLRVGPGGALLLTRAAVGLSLCMIVRDNAGTIEACLQSIRPWVDEMVVVDTGSKDETQRIAQRLGARVFHFRWCDDFSAARNESLRHAQGEWIFWMDSDDTIDAECGRQLKELVAHHKDPSILGFVMQVHCPGAGDNGHVDVTVVDHVKLFRNRPDLRFEGRIHEQIIPAIRRAGGDTAWTNLFVLHSGYDHSPEGQERKKQRDLHLLHLELQERPDHPFTLFNLGMTYTDVGDYRQGAQFLQRSIAHSGPADSQLRKAYGLLVYCQARLGDPQVAWETCCKGLTLFPEDLELRFRKGILLHEAGRLQEAVQTYQDILRQQGERYFTSVDRGMQGFKARQNLALVYTDLGDLASAEKEWRLVVEEMPHYRAGWHGLGDILLRQGKHSEVITVATQLLRERPLRSIGLILASQVAAAQGKPAEARRGLEQAVRDNPDDLEALQYLCRFLFEFAGPAEAEQPLRNLLQRSPEDAAAYHNLGTVYLQTGRPHEAIEAYRQSLRYRPHSPGTALNLGYALREGGRLKDAVDAWKQTLRLDPSNAEANEALRLASGVQEKIPRRDKANSQGGVAPTKATYQVQLRDRTTETSFLTRGVVDQSILQQIWKRDVYGVRSLAEAPALVVDIGAHIGSFSLMAAEAWPKARIIAAEADPDNAQLLRKNLARYRTVEVVEAAVIGEDVSEIPFNQVVNKARDNSGGGSCVRTEPGTISTKVGALSIITLWKSRKIKRCDFMKLDCEGAEMAILKALAGAELLADVRLIVGEWHVENSHEANRNKVKNELRRILQPTHDVEFSPHGSGREGYFTARLRQA